MSHDKLHYSRNASRETNFRISRACYCTEECNREHPMAGILCYKISDSNILLPSFQSVVHTQLQQYGSRQSSAWLNVLAFMTRNIIEKAGCCRGKEGKNRKIFWKEQGGPQTTTPMLCHLTFTSAHMGIRKQAIKNTA